MNYLRQIGTGILLAVISIAIVLGGFALANAESQMAGFAPATITIPTAYPSNMPATPVLVSPLQLTAAVLLTGTQEQPTLTVFPTFGGLQTQTPQFVYTCPPPAGWMAIIVQPLDTLTSIALSYQMTEEAIIQGNCLAGDQLRAGSLVYVQPRPGYTQIAATRVPCGAPYGWVDYYVAAGDTLYNIGLRYQTTVSELQRANCLGSSTNIQVGQRLKVPYVAATATPLTTPTPSWTAVPSPTDIIPTLPSPTIEVPSPTTEPLPTATDVPPATEPPAATAEPPTVTPFSTVG